MEAILEDLDRIRAGVASKEGGDTFFYLHVMGGAWTRVNLKKTSDAIAVYARAGCASEWCEEYDFPKQASFSYQKYDGVENVVFLANEFSRRAHLFFNQFFESADVNFLYSFEDRDSYEESCEFSAFMATLPYGHTAYVRGQVLRNTFPCLG